MIWPQVSTSSRQDGDCTAAATAVPDCQQDGAKPSASFPGAVASLWRGPHRRVAVPEL
jgi:hypothetical protein